MVVEAVGGIDGIVGVLVMSISGAGLGKGRPSLADNDEVNKPEDTAKKKRVEQ